MDALAERLDSKLREWKPETAELARQRIAEIIEATDQGGLDILRSCLVEQETLDLIDAPVSLAESYRMTSSELNELGEVVRDNCDLIVETWNEFFPEWAACHADLVR